MHLRKRYSNPTPPRQCGALVEAENGTSVACHNKVFRAGRCIEHYNEWRLARKYRENNITRYRRIVEDGKVYYSVRAMDQGETPSVSLMLMEQCVGNYGRCLKQPQLNANNTLWCMGHFQRDQRRRRNEESRRASRAS